MLFRTHFVFGIFLYLILFLRSDFYLIFLFGLLLGVLIVDIDLKNSIIGRFFLFRPLQLFFKHRGIIHSIFFGFILMILFSIFNLHFSFAFFIGFISHLFLDLFNRRGILVFWPLTKKRFGFKVKSGGIIEDVFFVFFLILDILLLSLFFVEKFNILF